MCPGGAIATVATCPGTILAIGGAPGGAWTSVAIGGGSIRVGPCTILATGGPATDVATDALDPMGSSSSSHTHRLRFGLLLRPYLPTKNNYPH